MSKEANEHGSMSSQLCDPDVVPYSMGTDVK